MSAVLERKSTVTAKGQTTIPKPVRDALGVPKHGEIGYRIHKDGSVSLFGVPDDDSDAAMNAFLNFLDSDITAHPGNVKRVSLASIRRAAKLVEDVELGEDENIEGDVGF